MTPVELELSEVCVRRAGLDIVSGISLTLRAGDALLLRGPNGSGKTSLIRTIAGLLPLGSGAIRLNPDDGLSRAERAHHIGHANAVNGALSVEENLAFWGDFLDGSRDGVERALEAFALWDLATFPVGLLSAGQKRRAGLARLLVAERPLWLLDEPTTSLDREASALLARAVELHRANGGIAVIATHLPLALAGAKALDLGDAAPDVAA